MLVSLLLQQHFLWLFKKKRKKGFGAVVIYLVFSNGSSLLEMRYCLLFSGETVKQHVCFCMILSKIDYS